MVSFTFDVGQRIDVVGPSGTLRQCTVVAVTEEALKVHYDDFDQRYDEWIARNSTRIKYDDKPSQRQRVKPECEIKICLRDLIGKEHHLQMLSWTEVSQLQDVVLRVWGIPPVFQMLVVGEYTLKESEALDDHIWLDSENMSGILDPIVVMVLVCADAVSAALEKLSNYCPEKEAVEILNNLAMLGQRNGAHVVKTVALLLEDRNDPIRRAAHRALVKIARRGDKDAIELLSEALTKPTTRSATVSAMKCIAEVGDEDAIYVMMSYLQSHGDRVVGEPEVLVEFTESRELNYAPDYDAKIRQALEEAGYEGDRLEEYKFRMSMVRWKGHMDIAVQTVFWEAVWHAGQPMPRPRHTFLDQSAFPVVLVLSFLQENNVEVCLAALEVLGHVAGKGNQMAIAAVAACLEDESDDVQWKAVEQLGLVIAAGDDISILHAKRRLKHEDRRVRWAAQEALGQFIEKSDD